MRNHLPSIQKSRDTIKLCLRKKKPHPLTPPRKQGGEPFDSLYCLTCFPAMQNEEKREKPVLQVDCVGSSKSNLYCHFDCEDQTLKNHHCHFDWRDHPIKPHHCHFDWSGAERRNLNLAINATRRSLHYVPTRYTRRDSGRDDNYLESPTCKLSEPDRKLSEFEESIEHPKCSSLNPSPLAGRLGGVLLPVLFKKPGFVGVGSHAYPQDADKTRAGTGTCPYITKKPKKEKQMRFSPIPILGEGPGVRVRLPSLLLVLFLLLLTGCSSSKPIIPNLQSLNNEINNIPLICPEVNSNNFNAIGLLGAYDLTINSNGPTAELTPKRTPSLGQSYLLNAISYYVITPCATCLKLKSLSYGVKGDS